MMDHPYLIQNDGSNLVYLENPPSIVLPQQSIVILPKTNDINQQTSNLYSIWLM